MTQSIRLALIYGGQSGEHEISLRSAASVIQHLDPLKYEIIPIGINKAGLCFINDYNELLEFKDSLPVESSKSKAIPALIQNGHFAVDVDVVIPVVHGPLYEDGCLQGLLNLANVAYVGCDTLPSALGMDKDIARRLARLEGVSSAKYMVITNARDEQALDETCANLMAQFQKPLFVKPCSLGSSVGIHKVDNLADLKKAIMDARLFDTEILVEEYVNGREIELAVLGVPGSMEPEVSIPGEISVQHQDGFYSYHAKYIDQVGSILTIPALLDEDVVLRLKKQAKAIFMALKCKGMARIDFFYNEISDEIIFNEINTIPGFTTISMFAKLWQNEGIGFSQVLDRLIKLALIRYETENQLITHYQ